VTVQIDDPRLGKAQCPALKPVEKLHSNPWFDVMCRGGYYTVESTIVQVSVLPVVEDRSVILVRVKRPVLNDVTLELPAGGVDPEETPAQAAAREFSEETGVRVTDAARFIPIPPLVVSSTRFPALPYLFQVNIRREEWDARGSFDSEIEGVDCVDFEDLRRMIADSTMYVSLPMAIISRFLFQRALAVGARVNEHKTT